MTNKIDWEKIRREWEGSNITFRELAEKHGVKLGTLKSRRSREKWSRDATKKERDATGDKKDATGKKKKSTSKRKRKRSGNPNPKNQFTKRNKAALKHGFYSKQIPEETLELMREIDEINPADILWTQITIQYAAIIRAQRIMFVRDEEDHSQFKKKEFITESYVSEDNKKVDKWVVEYDNVASWEKYSNYLSAQSRAMNELRNLIKQFVSMADDDDMRKLKIEAMQKSIDKTDAEIKKLQGDDLTEYESDGFVEALVGIEDVWSDDE